MDSRPFNDESRHARRDRLAKYRPAALSAFVLLSMVAAPFVSRLTAGEWVGDALIPTLLPAALIQAAIVYIVARRHRDLQSSTDLTHLTLAVLWSVCWVLAGNALGYIGALVGVVAVPMVVIYSVLAVVRPTETHVIHTVLIALLLTGLGTWFGLRVDERPLEATIPGVVGLVCLLGLAGIARYSRHIDKEAEFGERAR